MTAREMNDVDDFLNHRGNERGGGAYFNKWKQPVEKGGNGGKVNIWLHRRLPIAVWQHSWPRIVVREDRQTGEAIRNAWNGTFNCHEDESTLKKKDRDANGVRETPFRRCPLCRLIEWTRAAVDAGHLNWTDEIFRYEGDEDVLVLHAGGVFNAFGANDLTAEEKQELRDAGITKQKFWAFKENGQAKMAYVFCVIDNAHPEKGVQIATETQLLGDKVKTVIADRRESHGADAGNPFKSPYCIQWQNRPAEQEIQKKYHALPMENVKLTPEIQKALALPSPDLSKYLAPFDIDAMRATLERHCVLKPGVVPWDEIFNVEHDQRADDDEESEEGQDDTAGDTHTKVLPKEESEEAGGPDDDQLVPCEVCKHPFSPDDDTCPKCGAKYDENGALIKAAPPPPPPQPQRRGQNVGGKKMPF